MQRARATLNPTVSSDRKSTRLNSSHSLHDALPISQTGTNARNGGTDRHRKEMNKMWQDHAACKGHPEPDRFFRSEEHTSELQSLPTRRSSDLPDGNERSKWRYGQAPKGDEQDVAGPCSVQGPP